MIPPVKKYFLVLLVLYAIILLCACFWPFNFFQENFAKVTPEGISFSVPGIAYTRQAAGLEDFKEFTLVARITARSPGQSSWIISYGTDFETLNFLVGLYSNHLIVETRRGSQTMRASIEGALPNGKQTWLVATGTPGSLDVYLDGKLKREVVRAVPDTSQWRSGYPLVFGARSDGKYAWEGTLHDFAILDRACTPEEAERPEELMAASPSVTYHFTNRANGVIGNSGTGETGPLLIPKEFVPYRRASLMDLGDTWAPRPLWGDIALNVLAFVPLGVLLSFFLGKAFSPAKVMLLAIIAGFGLSLSVEMMQVYLPRRWSTFMDVSSNSFGTLLGSASWYLGIGKLLRTKLSRAAATAETPQDSHQ